MQTATPDRTQCDRARLARDARFDGLFFTAVRSTGIYCRPVCPAPPPKPANVSYYPTAAAASAAGYRPCLRCRPELSPQAQQHLGEESVQRALAMIADGALQEQPVQTLADAVGLSARQLQRQFVQQLGATPIQVHGTHRLLLAKQLLTETALPVTEVALAAGFNSLRRFNAAFLQGCGMPPSALRKQRAEVPGGELTLRLGYRPPLDLPAMLAFLQRRAIPGIEQVDANGYRRVIGAPGNASVIEVSAAPLRAELLLRIGATDPRQIPQIVRRVRRLFDLDADLQTCRPCTPRSRRNRCWPRQSRADPAYACPVAGTASKWRCVRSWGNRSAWPARQRWQRGWSTATAAIMPTCPPDWIAVSPCPNSWPTRRWNSSGCRVRAPPRCVRWPRPARKASCTSAPDSACLILSPPAPRCPESDRGPRITWPCACCRIRTRFRPAT